MTKINVFCTLTSQLQCCWSYSVITLIVAVNPTSTSVASFMEVRGEHGWDSCLKADTSSDSCDLIAAKVLYCRERKKSAKGIHIRWQGGEEEGSVFNISDSLLLNVVPEPLPHWVAEWGGRFALTWGNNWKSLFLCFVRLDSLLCEMWLVCGFAHIAWIIDLLDDRLHICWKIKHDYCTRLLCIAFSLDPL